MDNSNHPTGYTYDLSLVPEYAGYEWLPEPDENGRTIYKPHKMETKAPEAMEMRRLNHQVDTLLEMAKHKIFKDDLEENLSIHRRIGAALFKWRSEALVRINPQEVEALTIYQFQLLTLMDQQREDRAMKAIQDGFQVEVVEETRASIGLPPISHEGFKK